MVKRIVWSRRAKDERREILEYWHQRNKSKVYSKKLFRLFQLAVYQIRENPTMGKSTSLKSIRMYIIKDYLMFYEILESRILILTIWDSRQNPVKLKL